MEEKDGLSAGSGGNSSPLDSSATSNFELKPKQLERLLSECSVQIHDSLHMETVFPYLVQEDLLTPGEEDKLCSLSSVLSSDEAKITYLVKVLPKKGKTALPRFLKCLQCTTGGTAHIELAEFIRGKANELREGNLKVQKGWRKCTLRSLWIVSISVVIMAALYGVYSSGYFHSHFLYHVYWRFSKRLPACPSTFVGRTSEHENILQLMDKHGKIIHIVGPPGFGKSSLAICVGNSLISKGFVVRYIQMEEITHQPVKQVIAEKILFQESTYADATNVTFDQLLSWSSRRVWHNLVIFDNCDEPLNHQRDQFNEAIEKLVQQSNYIKVLITSREESLYLEEFRTVKIDSLSIDESCELLEHKTPSLLNMQEKIAIANLTGGVPLALQIVGSLLNKRLNPPTPSSIIEELRLQPIPTLSPGDLNIKMRINASISVSYKYLELKPRKVARYLSNFPGSFTKSIATAVLRSASSKMSEIASEEYMETCLGRLVTRSLLEYSIHSGRYHFHLLLREFFRDVQLNNHRAERGRFVLAFQLEISHWLQYLAGLFAGSPKKALSTLDDEGHNVQHLVRITHRPYNCSHMAYSVAVAAIDEAIASNFLSCRFSADELIEPTYSIVYIMENKVLQEEKEHILLWHFARYVDFVVHYANFLSNINGSKVTADWLMSHVRNVEKTNKKLVDTKIQRQVATVYNNFYFNLLKYEQHIDDSRVRIYNSRILRKITQLQPESERVGFYCEERRGSQCPYKDIATAYYHIKEFDKSIQFLEKAWNVENSLSEQVALSTYLVQSYEYTGHSEKAINAFQRTVVGIYEHVLQSPSTLAISHFRIYVRILRNYGETQKALTLERKELHELLETGANGGITQALRAYDFGRQLFHQKNYTEAIAMATLALRIMEQNNFVDDMKGRLGLKILIGKAEYHSGNSSGSLVHFKEVADWILQQEVSSVYPQEYYDSCWYLMFHVKYFNECYLNKYSLAGANIITAGLMFGYYLIVPPLDLYVGEEEEEKHNMNHFEELMSLSGLTDIMLHSDDSHDFALSTVFHYPDTKSEADEQEESQPKSASRIEAFFQSCFKFALRFTVVRGVINVVLIVVKLTCFAATMFCVYRCLNCCGCGCCFCCCHLLHGCITRWVSLFSIVYTYLAIKYFGNSCRNH